MSALVYNEEQQYSVWHWACGGSTVLSCYSNKTAIVPDRQATTQEHNYTHKHTHLHAHTTALTGGLSLYNDKPKASHT